MSLRGETLAAKPDEIVLWQSSGLEPDLTIKLTAGCGVIVVQALESEIV